MRYLSIFILLFLFNFIQLVNASENSSTTTIEVDVRASAALESEAKKKAFEEALYTASQKVLMRHVAEDQKYLIADLIMQEDLKKFFKKVDVINFEVSDLDSRKEFIGTFRFHFELSDIKRWLEDNNLTFIEEMVTTYQIVQIPIFIESGTVYHWFDSKISEALLYNAKKINNFEIALIEPNLKVISVELLNIYKMHQFAKRVQERLSYDGYNLIICQVTKAGGGKLECENHLIYKEKRFMENVNLSAIDLNGGKQLASEINSIFLSGFTEVVESVGMQDERKQSGLRRDIILELRYGKLSSLLSFQELLTQNPYIMYYKVGESSLGYAKFSIQLRSELPAFTRWLEENGLVVRSISDETGVIVAQFEE